MGQQTVQNESEVKSAYASVESRSKELFKDAGVYMEKYFPKCHHIEVQVKYTFKSYPSNKKILPNLTGYF